MGSFDLQRLTRIGAMNRAIGAPASGTARFKPFVANAPWRRPALRFMERASHIPAWQSAVRTAKFLPRLCKPPPQFS